MKSTLDPSQCDVRRHAGIVAVNSPHEGLGHYLDSASNSTEPDTGQAQSNMITRDTWDVFSRLNSKEDKTTRLE